MLYIYLFNIDVNPVVIEPPKRFHVQQESEVKADSGLKLMIRPIQYYFYFPVSQGRGFANVVIGLKNVSPKPILVRDIDRNYYDFFSASPPHDKQGFTIYTASNPPPIGLSYSHRETYFLSFKPKIQPNFRWLYPGKMQVTSLFHFSTSEFSVKQPTTIELQMSYSMSSITLPNGIRSWGGILHSNTIKFQVAPVR